MGKGKGKKKRKGEERRETEREHERVSKCPDCLATQRSSPEPAPLAGFGRRKQVLDPPCLVQTFP